MNNIVMSTYDLDHWISCWIKDVPYIWSSGKTHSDCKREYLVEPHQIVYMKKCSKSIGVDSLEYMIHLGIISKTTQTYYFKDIMDCEHANLFQVFIGDYKNLPPLRCNGIPIEKVPDIIVGTVILAHGKEFPTKSLNEFSTNVCENSRLINIIIRSHLQDSLKNLIMKRVPRLIWREILPLLQEKSDFDIYEYLRQIYVGVESEKWGERFNPAEITGRAQSRINELKDWLPVETKSILDIGAGNAEIICGFAKYLNISSENIWAVDVENYIEPGVKLNFIKVSEKESLPIPDASIDLCLLFQSMHHMRDLEYKLHEIARVLKPGGTLFVREHDCRDQLTSLLIDIEHELYDCVVSNSKTNYTGTVYRSRKEWTILLKEFGFEFVSYGKLFSKTNPTKYYNAVYKKKIL